LRPPRLICFPHAGGTSQAFHGWGERLAGVTVDGFEPPGRARRLRERPIRDIRALAEDAAARVSLDAPFALLGHSVGALVAYELACELRRRDLPQPAALIVCGHRAPQLPLSAPPAHVLPDRQLMAHLLAIGATPPEVAADDELWGLLLPSIRADLELSERYVFPDSAPLGVPVVAFGGTDDLYVSRAELEDWAATTTTRFSLHLLPGDHFFMRSAEERFFRTLAVELGTLWKMQSALAA
jgi:medium-chain acyl-[acyl-carrier-protein] hydrolase